MPIIAAATGAQRLMLRGQCWGAGSGRQLEFAQAGGGQEDQQRPFFD